MEGLRLREEPPVPLHILTLLWFHTEKKEKLFESRMVKPRPHTKNDRHPKYLLGFRIQIPKMT